MEHSRTKGHITIQIFAFILLGLILLLVIGAFVNSAVTHAAVEKIIEKETIDKEDLSAFKEFIANCHSVLNASSITYLVTLIIALLAALLLNRIEKIESLVHRNQLLEEQMNYSILKSTDYNILLTRIETIFNIVAMIDNLSALNNGDNSQIGVLCSRISILSEKINEDFRLNKLRRLKKIHDEEKQILMAYIDDIIGIYKRTSDNLRKNGAAIQKNVDKRRLDMEDIKEKIEMIIGVE